MGDLAGRISLHGLSVRHMSISELRKDVRKGDLVYGLFVYEGRHVLEEVIPIARHSGASWMGIPSAALLASIVADALRRRGVSMVYVAGGHMAKGFEKKLLGRLAEVAWRLRREGFEASYGLKTAPVPRGVVVAPLVFFKGLIWSRICGYVEQCLEPLLAEGAGRIADWVLSSLLHAGQ